MSSMIPTGDTKGLQWMKAFRDQVSGNLSLYKLIAADITAINNAVNDFDAKLLTATTPSTRTPGSIDAKNASKANASAVCRKYAILIKYNQTIPSDAKIDAGIKPPNNTRTPVAAPDAAPAMELDGVTGRNVAIRVYDPTDATKRKKPDGVIGASIYTFTGTSYPSDPAAWQFAGNITKDKHTVTFDNSIAPGTQVWITATWYTRKAETGPLAEPITTHIQYGLSQAA